MYHYPTQCYINVCPTSLFCLSSAIGKSSDDEKNSLSEVFILISIQYIETFVFIGTYVLQNFHNLTLILLIIFLYFLHTIGHDIICKMLENISEIHIYIHLLNRYIYKALI